MKSTLCEVPIYFKNTKKKKIQQTKLQKKIVQKKKNKKKVQKKKKQKKNSKVHAIKNFHDFFKTY